MNLSPFAGPLGVKFAADARVLASQLEECPRIALSNDYFCVEDGLESWRALLACRRW